MDRVRKQLGISDEISSYIDRSVGIGILDSGIYAHPDLKGNIRAVKNFIEKSENSYDYMGHGTHVAGIIAADGKSLGGKYRGIAPGSSLYIGKILNRKGRGKLDSLFHGLTWFYQNRERFSMQYQSKSGKEKIEKLEYLCQKLYEENVLIVAAAGNGGPGHNTLSLLAASPYVVAVGCHDGAFKFPGKKMCAEYSGNGPGKFGRIKPDVVAPGTAIVSCANYGRGYVAKSGTSMATPIVSALAALLFSRCPSITSAECMHKLRHTAYDLGENTLKQGFGMVNPAGLLDIMTQ